MKSTELRLERRLKLPQQENDKENNQEKLRFLNEINKRLKKNPSKKELLRQYNEKWQGHSSQLVGQSQELPSGILPPNRREVENSRGSRVDNSIDDYLQNRPSQVNTFSNSNSKNHSRSVTPDNKSRTITPDRFNNLRQKDSNPNKVLLNKQPRKSNQESLELTFNHSTHSSEQEHQHELRDSHSFLTNATNTYDANNSNSKVNSHSRSLEIVNVMKEEEPVNIRKKYNFKLNLKKAINPVENANNLNIVSKSVNNNIKPSHKPLTELIGNSYNNKNKNNSDNQENDENMLKT
eukprot:CAMPEP_0116899128 /NCGR_PEP_ID=MMETSP0467-20121206/7751_1 /TAXON_ID=283647 /ORGANISM="Mesodinium pulex, Strain SPMC105" /LENGTH=292 /DNA_ID=CAMNT_0004571747 /DNA_START=152 /DNA_END=1033 /DNA_ORIENTATION=+